MRTLLFGSKGQLGADLIDVWSDDIKAFAHAELDISDRAAVLEAVTHELPELVINAAAYTRVDECETNSELAFEVNAVGAKNVAEAAQASNAAVMFISTDYVFDGEQGSPYAEDDVPAPLNVYGVSKLAGEHFVRQSNPRHYVVRTSSLFGVNARSNFVEAVIRKAQAGEPLRVVDDQISSPTFTHDLAMKLQELAATDAFGLYHITNPGSTSWYGLAAKVFDLMGMDPTMTPITSEELALPARRPAFSVLENGALAKAGLAELRPWEQAIAAYLAAKGHTSG